jgi:hypothetical protein
MTIHHAISDCKERQPVYRSSIPLIESRKKKPVEVQPRSDGSGEGMSDHMELYRTGPMPLRERVKSKFIANPFIAFVRSEKCRTVGGCLYKLRSQGAVIL